MAQKCVHKGCGKTFSDPEEECIYHSGPPVFHEGQKGWKCCKPRVLTFDEFLTIPPCTRGRHSTVDDTPQPEPKAQVDVNIPTSAPTQVESKAAESLPAPPPRLPQTHAAQQKPPASPAPPEDEDDDPALLVPDGAICKRRGCNATYKAGLSRDGESCVHHPGAPIFHEGSKGYLCCKRRVLEFDEFMKLEGCKTKDKHLFVGSGKKSDEENLETVRSDFYQTGTSVIASFYLKKIDKETSTIKFVSSQLVELDLHTSDNKRYKKDIALFGKIDTEKSTYKVMGTKLEFNLIKADGLSWQVLKADDRHTGEIIQTSRAGRV